MFFGHNRLVSPAVYGSSGSSSPSTVTQVQQIPQFQQDEIQNNEELANSLAASPFPQYQAPIVAGLNSVEQSGLDDATNSAYSYQPALDLSNSLLNQSNAIYGSGQATNNVTGNAQYGASAVAGMNPVNTVSGMNPLPATSSADNALQNYTSSMNPANPGVIQQFMSPYVQASLNPQLLAAQQNLNSQQAQINAGATSAGAFGSSRQGTENALQNYYGQQTMAGIEGAGYNTAYNSALGAAAQQQQIAQTQVQNQNALGQLGVNEQTMLGTLGTNEQGVMQNQQTLGQNQDKVMQSEQQLTLAQAQQQAANALQQQNQALTGANAQYNAGNIAQQNDQAQLTAAYQQYLDATNWPYQMLNVQESAVNSSPYQLSSAVTVPQNSTQQGLAAFTSLAGAAGALTGSGTSTTTGTK